RGASQSDGPDPPRPPCSRRLPRGGPTRHLQRRSRPPCSQGGRTGCRVQTPRHRPRTAEDPVGQDPAQDDAGTRRWRREPGGAVDDRRSRGPGRPRIRARPSLRPQKAAATALIGGIGGACGGSCEASGVAPRFEPGREPALDGLLDLSLPAATIIAPTEGVEAAPARTEPRSEAAPSATAAVVVTATAA